MTEDKLKTTLGIFLIIAHFLVILLVVSFYFLEAFLFDEMTTTLALIIPMFAVYTTVIIKSIIENKTAEDTRATGPVGGVTNAFVFVSLFLPTLFTSFVLALIILKAFNVGFDSFEQFKILLGLAETIFAIYVGQIIGSLFDKHKKKKKNA